MKSYLLIAAFLVSEIAHAQITFAPCQYVPIASYPKVVAIADLNNDGLNDIVIASTFYFDSLTDYKLYLFYQNSNGNLDSPVVYSYPQIYAGLITIAVGDVNNDQRNDIVIGYSDSIGIFYQNSAGTLNSVVTYYSGTNVNSVKIGDLNNDGLNDIAVSHGYEFYIKIFYQTSSGFNPLTYPKLKSGFDEIEIGDINNDGLDDLVLMAGSYIEGIFVYSQNANGNLNGFVFYIGIDLGGIAIGDLNNDGRNDVAASKSRNCPNCKMYLLFQDTVTGLLKTPDTLDAYEIPEPVEIADLNCDGRNEIVTLHTGWGRASVYEQNSLNNYSGYSLINLLTVAYYVPQALSIGDINHDGRKDIVFADVKVGLVILYNTSPPTNLTVIDTIASVDTITQSAFVNSSYFETVTVVDDKSSCMIQQKDSFTVTASYKSHEIRIDSLFIREGVICAYQYSDSVATSQFKTDTLLLAIDTNHVSTTIDTVFTNPITNFTLEKNTSLFPVPTNEVIILALTNPCYTFYRNTEALIAIYNDKGAEVFSSNVFTNDFPINLSLSNYSCGIYFLRCTSTDNSFTKKIIKVN